MGYLSKSVGSGNFTMNAATVSVWFSVPTVSDAAVAVRDASFTGNAILAQTVPLLMWGSQGTDPDDGPYGPSWIGVFFDRNFDFPPSIAVNIQTQNFASL